MPPRPVKFLTRVVDMCMPSGLQLQPLNDGAVMKKPDPKDGRILTRVTTKTKSDFDTLALKYNMTSSELLRLLIEASLSGRVHLTVRKERLHVTGK